MTEQQKAQQCDGPGRPTVAQLRAMLAELPAHFEVRAVSVNGQACVTVVEVVHEGMDQHHMFLTNGYRHVLP
ncbi:MAG: hypothetical protein EBV03_10695 [Proteobacteria bacterium]|nr:hypothetical protein [Pseudomonadota bacterium]